MLVFFMVAVLGILAVLGIMQVRLALREGRRRWLIIPGVLSGIGAALFVAAWMEIERVNALRAVQQAPGIFVSVDSIILIFLVLQVPALIYIFAWTIIHRIRRKSNV
ncbi:MAG: hypothetical protein FWB88_00695 [Defluviitaleaceae bacterium]|nr:hypothetical protein [Defluviitaleaceae bacterium]MCL2238958.1 hypothetical protein [Defluviitaleaceae bacterium]